MKPEDKAVVQQALETFKKLPILAWTPESAHEIVAAMTALCQLLERTEPVFCEYCGGNDDADFGLPTDHCTDCDRPDPAQPADHSEQHLDMVDHGDELTIAYLDGVHTGKRLVKREWVGLTEDEADKIYKDGSTFGEMMRMVEAKLREKNGGAAQPADHTEQHLDMVRALDALLVVQDEPCSIDHHGYCQSHYLDNVNSYGGCRVANARALVAKVRGKP